MRTRRNKTKLIITETDHVRLRNLIEHHRIAATESPWALLVLEQQLDNAQIVPSRQVPHDVVTMRSKVRVRIEDDQKPAVYTIEYPRDVDPEQGSISILSPLATAVLGERSGEDVPWNLAAGVTHYKIDSILYQPEAAGHFDR
jgi:regulator of nucleoside diphosphate kinase